MKDFRFKKAKTPVGRSSNLMKENLLKKLIGVKNSEDRLAIKKVVYLINFLKQNFDVETATLEKIKPII